MRVEIYTDGACSDNGKKSAVGGWAVVMRALRKKTSNQRECVAEKVLTGAKRGTTNNEMELTAILEALKAQKAQSIPNHMYHIYTDSKYCIECIENWSHTWRRNGWKTKGGEPVKNKELLQEILKHRDAFGGRLTFHWVKGHANHPINNRVDELAVQAKEELMEASR